MENKDKNKRRKILTYGIAAGAGVLVGTGLNSIVKISNKQTKKMLTASGQLVEVDISNIPVKKRKKPVSNEVLREWMNNENK